MKRLLFIFTFLFTLISSSAQNWDYIKSSGEYYYGEGFGKTEEEADNNALVALSSMIATHVTSDFRSTTDQTNRNGQVDHTEYVRNCMQSYTQAFLTNCHTMHLGTKNGVVHCGRYMLRSELAKIFALRVEKAQEFVRLGDSYLKRNSVGLALQYYFWAYALVSSVQYPDEVRDDQGQMLVVSLPDKMRQLLGDIKIEYRNKDDDFVDMVFSYKGQAIASELYFTYNDGQGECSGCSKNGNGTIQMRPGFDGEYCHVDIDYACLGRSTDQELKGVLDVVKVPPFAAASHTVKIKSEKGAVVQNDATQRQNSDSKYQNDVASPATIATGVQLQPSVSQVLADNSSYDAVMQRVISAIRRRCYSDAMSCFTLDGLEIFNRLIDYGKGRIVGTPDLKYFKSFNNTVTVRGLEMSFAFNSRSGKATFNEDMVFTFDADGKICNIAFGLGKDTESSILTKYAPDWSDLSREVLMEFLENYKTAYSLERLDYIRDIFSDDAIIIVGNATQVFTRQTGADRQGMSMTGREIIKYNRYTKDEYLNNLSRCFNRNDFINIRFTKCDVQPLEKLDGEVYGIQVGQDYQSSTYNDFGYLFLMVNMTDPDKPYIKVRTWQEKPDPNFGWYNAGNFAE